MTTAADERVILEYDDVQIYDTDIDRAIDEACQKYGIEDLTKESQQRWKAVLRYVGRSVFPDNKVLKDKTLIYNYNNNILTNNNKYNTGMIMSLYNYYSELADRYNKAKDIVAFSYFANISDDTVRRWKNLEPSTTGFMVWEKARQERLEALLDRAYDSSNVTGTMFVGNSEYSLNLPGTRDNEPKPAEQTQAQIAEHYGQPIPIDAPSD